MNRLKLVAVTALAMCASAQTLLASAQEAATKPTVLFVCEHGSVKSLLASRLFERAAAREGLTVRAISRGTAPDETVPQWMRTQLEREGLDIGEWRPSALSSADVQSAERVVVFDVSLPADVAAKADHWDGLPSVSKDYRSGRDAIASKVDALVAELKREGKERSD